MSDSNGFIDLRVGHGARGVGDDSVWPSFTVIMTVIVMIFLMALVVIMVRNFELDRQLLSTISAKDATALANGLNRVLDDSRFAAGLGTQARMDSQNYIPERYVEQMQEIYLKLLSGSGSD